MVTILTDGMENASREYTRGGIKALVEELKEQRWTFTYIGTDHDVEEVADRLSIKNSLPFKNCEEGISNMFFFEKSARIRYSENLMNDTDVSLDYYKAFDQETLEEL